MEKQTEAKEARNWFFRLFGNEKDAPPKESAIEQSAAPVGDIKNGVEKATESGSKKKGILLLIDFDNFVIELKKKGYHFQIEKLLSVILEKFGEIAISFVVVPRQYEKYEVLLASCVLNNVYPVLAPKTKKGGRNTVDDVIKRLAERLILSYECLVIVSMDQDFISTINEVYTRHGREACQMVIRFDSQNAPCLVARFPLKREDFEIQPFPFSRNGYEEELPEDEAMKKWMEVIKSLEDRFTWATEGADFGDDEEFLMRIVCLVGQQVNPLDFNGLVQIISTNLYNERKWRGFDLNHDVRRVLTLLHDGEKIKKGQRERFKVYLLEREDPFVKTILEIKGGQK